MNESGDKSLLTSPKNYKIICEVGSGTYGVVYKAICELTNKYVALKRLDLSKQELDGFPITAIREIKLLKMLKHQNIIKLIDIIMSKASIKNQFRGSTFLVFEYMDHDFAGLKNIKINFSLSQIKGIMLQILQGVKYLHEKKIMHRDLKSANILLNNRGEVKIADFGLARQLAQAPQMLYTNKVVTLWYRAPELLLGSNVYNFEVDIWSIGCIFYELLTGEILFAGDKESKQLELIYEKCGTPDSYNWPEADQLRFYKDLGPKSFIERKLKMFIKKKKIDIDEWALDLLDKFLILNPKFRITSEEALNHDFFKQNPLPSNLNEMPKIEKECHEGLFKDKHKKQTILSEGDNKNKNFEYRQKFNNNNRNNLAEKPKDNVLIKSYLFHNSKNLNNEILDISNKSNEKIENDIIIEENDEFVEESGLSGLQSLIAGTKNSNNQGKRDKNLEENSSFLDKLLGKNESADANDILEKARKKIKIDK